MMMMMVKRLEHESIYQLNMRTDTENNVKQCATCLDYLDK